MKKIGLVTTEAADIPQEIVEQYQIAITPVKLDWPDLEKMSGENTFQKMRELERRGIKSFGKTSQPSPNDFIEQYRTQLKRFEKVICITLTSKLSGTYNSAILARNFLDPKEKKRVFVVDSLNASCGEALVILKAIDLIEKGRKITEIIEELGKVIPKIHLFAILKDPKWLQASGRISSTLANWIRKMAKIGVRPLIGVKKGVAVPIGIITRAKDIPTALFRRLEIETRKLRKAGKEIRVVITHGDDLSGSQTLKKMIEGELKEVKVVFINLIDNVLGVLVGPGVLACAWCEI